MLLERLIKSLSEEEHARLRKELALPARSEKIFERFCFDGTAPTTSDLCAEFGLSKSNVYRLCSEIADECVRILATSGEFPKLEFYQKKFLAAQFTSELARTEAKLLQGTDREVLERFYELAFTGMMGFPLTDIDIDLMRSYGIKWHRTMRNPPIDHELEIEMKLVFLRIGGLPSWKKMTVDMMHTTARSILDPITERASTSPNALVRYYYFQSEWKASNFQKVEGEERVKWVKRSLEVVTANESVFPTGALDTMQLQLAYERAMYCGEIQTGYQRFKQSYRGQIPNTSRNTIFLIRFIRLSLIAKEFDTARQILNVLDSFPYTRLSAGIYQPYLLLRSALHIVEGEIDQAVRLSTISRTMNVDEHYFLSFEVESRALEVLCAYRHNDFELADLLVTRDMKWLYSKRYSFSQSAWPYYYKTIKACIIYKMTGERPKPMLKKQFEEFKIISHIYAMLLEKDTNILFDKDKS